MVDGVRYLGRGISWVARRPAQWVFGLIPALLSLVLFAGLLTWLGFQVGDLVRWMTPFADDWASGVRDALRVIAGVAVFGAALFASLLLFTAVTLVIGEPFYEALATRVEDSVGGAPPEPDEPFWRGVGRSVRDALILGAAALAFGVLFFALGFIPVVGQTVVPVVALIVSGYFLTGELTGIAMERRLMSRKERFALLKSRRATTLGFGTATAVLFLIPLGAVLFMPGAVAGATLMARDLCEEDTPEPPKVA
ncbi:EI24 domain-containing protein [Actinocorallia populi]|uniref:EI24 domain-containing protein n=1 Tax=Actinocorallia populi TaxID=2079200 RepID=UPI000D09624F|nr:EI24 domain-containing protein [Actinocorallia populi]